MRDTRLSESPERSEPTEHYIFNDSQTIVLERGYRWESTPESTPTGIRSSGSASPLMALSARWPNCATDSSGP